MITKKDIFLSKLKGKPVRIMKGKTTPEEVKILVDAGIIKLEDEWRSAKGVNIARALYPVITCGITKVVGQADVYKEMRIAPGKFLHY